MRTIPRTIALGAVAGIVAVSIGLGAAAPADAAGLNWLNGTRPGQFILNVLGSVLGGAKVGTQAGNLKQAAISQDLVWDHSWEGLEQQWKMKVAAGYDVPSSYQDYVLQEQDYFNKNNLTSKQGELSSAGNAKKYVNTKRKFPATKAYTWVKKVAATGAAIGAVAAWDHRAEIGSGVASLAGVDDTTGAVCSNSAFLAANGQAQFAGFQNWVTGSDCDAWSKAEGYIPNQDVIPVPDGWDHVLVNSGNTATPPTDNSFVVVVGDGMSYQAQGSLVLTVTKIFTGVNLANYFTVFCSSDLTIPALNGSNGMTPQYPGTISPNPQNVGSRQNGDYTLSYVCTGGRKAVKALAGPSGNPVSPGYSPQAVWGAPGTTAYHPGVSKDPDRQNVCTIVGSNGQTYTATSDKYTDTGSNPGVTFPALPDGVGVNTIGCQQTGGGTTSDILPQTQTTPEYQAWWGQYPECREGACSLQLIRKSDNKSCFDDSVVDSATNCADWFASPTKDTDYQCMYGAHNVSLTECYVYADVFKPDKVAAGQAYADPITGQSLPGQSSPGAAKTALSKTITDPSDFSGCLDAGWAAANPVEWVLVPIQCALQWAFAPRSTVINQDVQQLQTGWGSTTPAKVVTAVQAWKINPAPTGCALSVPFYSVIGHAWTNVPVIQACPGDPMGAVMPWVRGIVTVITGIGAAFACRRIVAKWVDYS